MMHPRLQERTVRGKAITVVGLGRSGGAAARLAARKGARSVVVQDRRSARELGEARVLELAREGLRPELGGHREATLRASDLIVVSPGVPVFPALRAAEAAGVPVVSEIELASWYVDADVLAVTGTNGKSTVTTLVGEMLRGSGRETFVGGNLGTPLCEVVDLPAAREGGAIVLELSSYQLERTYTLRSRVAVLINVTADHLDRYPSMAEYAAAKQRIFLNQTHADHAVVPGDDPVVLAMARAGGGQCHVWGTADAEVRVTKDAIIDWTGETFPLALLGIRGAHNVQNAMAAVLAARLFGASTRGIRQALETFTGLPHRMQRVLQDARGVAYFDDSKATNVGAAVKALEGVEGRVVLIGGGRHKGGSYAPLRPLLAAKGRGLVLIGEASEQMRDELGDVVPTRLADGMADAVRQARDVAAPGDTVLLAPACSSLDMFASYAERGEAFVAAVRAFVKPAVRREEDDGVEVDVEVDDS